MNKPKLEDFPQFYRRYIEKVIDKEIVPYLDKQKYETVQFFKEIGEGKSLYRYAENKWSIKEIVGHLCDTERILFIRALQFARNEKQELLGFEEDDYVTAANFDSLPFDVLIQDFVKMRESHISHVKTFNDEMFSRKGIANRTEFSVSSTLYVIAGHLDHHIQIIKERYL